jgi:PIN domain nuclease of toxin-antitoxin system
MGGSLPVITLLDTHALVWLLEGNPRLGQKTRDLVFAAAQAERLYVSAITPWEIAMLVSKGRLAFAQEIGEWLKVAFAMPGIRLAPLSIEISVASTQLPGDFHADPADRMIVATARHLGATLVTEDKLILGYSQTGYLKVQRAGT